MSALKPDQQETDGDDDGVRRAAWLHQVKCDFPVRLLGIRQCLLRPFPTPLVDIILAYLGTTCYFLSYGCDGVGGYMYALFNTKRELVKYLTTAFDRRWLQDAFRNRMNYLGLNFVQDSEIKGDHGLDVSIPDLLHIERMQTLSRDTTTSVEFAECSKFAECSVMVEVSSTQPLCAQIEATKAGALDSKQPSYRIEFHTDAIPDFQGNASQTSATRILNFYDGPGFDPDSDPNNPSNSPDNPNNPDSRVDNSAEFRYGVNRFQ